MYGVLNSQNSGDENYNENLIKAVGYWVILNDLREFFKNSNMQEVSHHISEACKEIDQAWERCNSR